MWWAFVWLHAWVPWYMCGGQRATSGTGPHMSPCLWQGLSFVVHWVHQADCPLSFQILLSCCNCRCTRLSLGFYVGSGNEILVPQTYMASILSTEPSPLSITLPLPLKDCIVWICPRETKGLWRPEKDIQSPGAEFQAVVSYPTMVLRAELGSFGKTVRALKRRAISPVLPVSTLSESTLKVISWHGTWESWTIILFSIYGQYDFKLFSLHRCYFVPVAYTQLTSHSFAVCILRGLKTQNQTKTNRELRKG